MSAAALVARLAQSGIDPELLAEVAQELFVGEIERKALAERKANDRTRKARSREVTGQDVTDAEVTPDPSPLDAPLTKVSQALQKNTPPLTPQPEGGRPVSLLKGIGLDPRIPAEPWMAFVRMRKAKDKGFTEDAARGAVRKLLKMAGQGYDPAKLLWRSVDNCWKSFFEHDDCKAAAKLDPAKVDWEDRARFYDKIGRQDEAADIRRRYTVPIGEAAQQILRRAS